jgi:acyl carrier protein
VSSVADGPDGIVQGVIEIIGRNGNVGGLTADQDFYDAGVTSVAALPILLDIEDHFAVSIPDGVFVAARTPQALAEIIAGLRAELRKG